MQDSRCENLHNIDLTPKVVFKNLLVVLFSTSETMATLVKVLLNLPLQVSGVAR